MKTRINQWKHSLTTSIKSRRFWLTLLRDMVLLTLMLFIVASYLQREMKTGIAPPILSQTIDGNPIDMFKATVSMESPLLTAQKNNVTLVYFWGSWCPACRLTSPMVNALVDNANSRTANDRPNKYQVLSIAVASGSNSDIKQFMRQHGYRFDVINESPQSTSDFSEQWGALALPAIYIVDDQNNIRFITSGVTTSWGLRARLWLAAALPS